MAKQGKNDRERLTLESIRAYADYMQCLLHWPKATRPRSFNDVCEVIVERALEERGEEVKANTIGKAVLKFIAYHQDRLMSDQIEERLFVDDDYHLVPSPKAVALYHAAKRIAEDFTFVSSKKWQFTNKAELRIASHNRFARNQMPIIVKEFDDSWANRRVQLIKKYDEECAKGAEPLDARKELSEERKAIIRAKWSEEHKQIKQMMWPERVDVLVLECDNDTVNDITERTRRGEVHFGLGTIPNKPRDPKGRARHVAWKDIYCTNLPQLAVVHKEKLKELQSRCAKGEAVCVSAVEWYAKTYLREWLDGREDCLLRNCVLTEPNEPEKTGFKVVAGRRIQGHDDATVMRYVEAGVADVGIVAYQLHPEDDIQAMVGQMHKLQWLMVEIAGKALPSRSLGVCRRLSPDGQPTALPEYAEEFIKVLLQFKKKFEVPSNRLDTEQKQAPRL